ncbi:MAG: biotin--[acetyl-CoA-carboxylase] ligase [Gemmatimonadota bacterium]|nr:biotin--[acetyl-CoA-carboxylase] ligase [Gemmatimonadota bacterium]
MSADTAQIIRVARVGSTMDAVHDLAQSGAPPGTVLIAGEQTAGRGSRGRDWSSPSGGLWVSVLARPAAAALELLSLRAGLATVETLAPFVEGAELALKWPNDLMLGDLKTGGILCEARWSGATLAWVVIGLGLNVANRPGTGLQGMATNLSAVRPGLSAAALAGPVIEALRAVDAAAGPLSSSEQRRFARRDWLAGRAVRGPLAGTADGIEADGALRVRRPDGTIATVRSGTIVLAATPTPAELGPCS